MKVGLSWLLCLLTLAANIVYAPPRCTNSFQLVYPGLPVRCSANFPLSYPLWRSSAASQRVRVRNRARVNPPADEWVNTQVNALVKAAHAAYQKDEAQDAYDKVLDRIVRAIKLRRLFDDPAFAARYPEFLSYIQAASIDRQPDHELGFIVPDRQYFEETRQYVQIPDFLLNQEFLRSVSRFESLERAKAFLRELNKTRSPDDQLIFFSYKSRHLGTPDNDDSYRRLLIVVPGNQANAIPEKWVQFGVTDPGERTRIRNLSVVSAVIGSDGTFSAYFKDYYRTYRRDRSISIAGRWELGFGDDNCAKCHKSGILPIFPEAGSVGPGEQQAVEAVNERFRSYGSPRFDKYLEPSRLGPGLGSATDASRERRFGEGSSKTDAGSSMTCSACHQPAGLGSLNWPMDRVLISSYVKGGQMPFGSTLTAADREELYEKLIQEYFSTDDPNPGILKSWLLGKSRSLETCNKRDL